MQNKCTTHALFLHICFYTMNHVHFCNQNLHTSSWTEFNPPFWFRAIVFCPILKKEILNIFGGCFCFFVFFWHKHQENYFSHMLRWVYACRYPACTTAVSEWRWAWWEAPSVTTTSSGLSSQLTWPRSSWLPPEMSAVSLLSFHKFVIINNSTSIPT